MHDNILHVFFLVVCFVFLLILVFFFLIFSPPKAPVIVSGVVTKVIHAHTRTVTDHQQL